LSQELANISEKLKSTEDKLEEKAASAGSSTRKSVESESEI
jgi:hypothetical protein